MVTATKKTPKRKTLRQLCKGKPSVALRAMCDGLRAADKRPGFIIAMWSYGHADKTFCYGCAATCTLQEITGVEFTPERLQVRRLTQLSFNRQAAICKLSTPDVIEFEGAMEFARAGHLAYLYDFLGIATESRINPKPDENWRLWDNNWRTELPKVRAFIRKLEKAGL